jgi:hypothetical protein
MTTAEFVAAHEHELIYGPAYDPSEAPFPEALIVTPLAPFPAPRVARRAYHTSTARRPRLTLMARAAAVLVALL